MKKALLFLAGICIIFLFVGCNSATKENYPTQDAEVSANLEKELTGNVFLDADVVERGVRNGTNTETIGWRAYIEISKDAAISSSMDDYIAFLEQRVNDSDYKWWTIYFDDGTAILFVGSSAYAAEYGTLDRVEGTLKTSYGIILPNEDGTYYYEKFED